MQIEYLTYFVSVADTLSISKTAGSFFITQQGLSRIVHLLENQYGAALLERHGNALSLTPAGRELAAKAQPVVEAYAELESAMKQFARPLTESASSPVVIYATPIIVSYLSHVLSRFPEKFINTDIIEADQETILSLLEVPDATGNSLFFLSLPQRTKAWTKVKESASIVFECFLKFPLALRVNKNSPLAAKKVITQSELRNIPLAYSKDTMFEEVLDMMLGSSDEHERNIFLKTSHLPMIESVIDRNLAAGFGSSFASDLYTEGYVLVPLENTVVVEFGMARHTDTCLTPSAEEIVDFISRAFRKLAKSGGAGS